MKERYLLFSGDTYYPLGGGRDFVAAFDTVEEAKMARWGGDRDWADIFAFDGITMRHVATAGPGGWSPVRRTP